MTKRFLVPLTFMMAFLPLITQAATDAIEPKETLSEITLVSDKIEPSHIAPYEVETKIPIIDQDNRLSSPQDLKNLFKIADRVKPTQLKLIEDNYDIKSFENLTFTCNINHKRQAFKDGLYASRCRPYQQEKPIYTLNFADTIIRSIIYSPQTEADFYSVESSLRSVYQAFSSWYPNISLSTGTLQYTNSLVTEYGATTTDSSSSSTDNGSSSLSSSTSIAKQKSVRSSSKQIATQSLTNNKIKRRGRRRLRRNPIKVLQTILNQISSLPNNSLTANQSTAQKNNSRSTSSRSSSTNQTTTEYGRYVEANPELTFNWTIYDPTRADKINAAKAALSSQEYQLIANAQQTALSASTLYGAVLAAEYALAGNLTQAIAAQNILDLYKRQFEQGYIDKGTVLLQTSQLQQAKYALLNSMATYLSSQKQLLNTIGLREHPGQIYFPQLILIPNKWPLPSTKTETLIAQNPNILSLQSESRQYESLAASYTKSYMPSLSILGYVTYEGVIGSEDYGPPPPSWSAWSSELTNYIGINISWTFFDGFSNYQQAKSYIAESLSSAKQSEYQLLQDQNQAIGGMQTLSISAESLRSLEASYMASLQALDSKTARFKVGFEDGSSIFEAQQQNGNIVTQYSSFYQQAFDALMTMLELTGLQLSDVLIEK